MLFENEVKVNRLNVKVNLNCSDYSIVDENVILLVEEGVLQLTKDFFLNFLEKIKELWIRFSNKMMNSFRTDKYEKNEKIITNKDLGFPEDFKVEIFPYWSGESLADSIIIPVFNENDKAMLKALEDEDEFRKKYFPNLTRAIEAKKEEDWVKGVKQELRGGPSVTLTGTEVNRKLPDIYYYFMQIRKKLNKLRDEYNKIEKAVKEAARKASNAKPNVKRIEQDEKKGTASGKPLSDGYTFEEIFLLGEVGETTLKEVNAKNTEMEKSNAEAIENQTVDKQDIVDTGSEEDRILKYYQKYAKLCQQVLTAEMTILEEKMFQYSKILDKKIFIHKKAEE